MEELDKLQEACQPATFGRNDEDVYDETYRKAGKMDVDNFMIGFDAERSGLIEAVRTLLFPGEEEKKRIKAELYKLNVYGAQLISLRERCSFLSCFRCGVVLQGA